MKKSKKYQEQTSKNKSKIQDKKKKKRERGRKIYIPAFKKGNKNMKGKVTARKDKITKTNKIIRK